MKAFLGATGYYLARSFVNRWRGLVKRLKNPRYLIGFIAVALYFWFFVIRHLSVDRSGEGAAAASNLTRWALTGIYLIQILSSWVFGAQGRGLAFKEAEVGMLFQAPLSRPRILLFKLLQLQAALVFSALFMSVLVMRVGTLSFPAFATGLWINGNFLYVHSVFMTLMMKSLRDRGGFRVLLARIPAIVFVGGLAVCVSVAVRDAGGLRAVTDARLVFEHPWVHAFLSPLSPFVDLVMATSFTGFAAAAVIPIAAFFVQAYLVVAADHRFEDLAIETARKVAGLKTEGLDALRKKGDFVVKPSRGQWFKLAPTGSAWAAFVWKNTISIGRMRRRALVGVVLASTIVCVFAYVGMRDEDNVDVRTVIGTIILIGTLYASLLAPAILRVDLRIDIPHFDVIKAMPIRGRDLMLGEILGPTFVVFGVQTALFTLSALFIGGVEGEVVGWDRKGPVLGAFIVGAFAIDFALFTGENLLAIFLPSFVRLGKGVRAGMDQFGQNLLAALVRLLGLVLVVVVPGVACGLVIGVGLHVFDLSIFVLIVPAVALAAAIVVLECWLLILSAERRYDRFDLSGENMQVE